MLRKRLPSPILEDLDLLGSSSSPIGPVSDKLNFAPLTALANPDDSRAGVLGLSNGEDLLGPGLSVLTTDAHDRLLGLPGTDKLRLATDKFGMGDSPLNLDLGSNDAEPGVIDTANRGDSGVPAREDGLVFDFTDLSSSTGGLGSLGSLRQTLRGARVKRVVSLHFIELLIRYQLNNIFTGHGT